VASASLICKMPPGVVNFDFNPQKIQMKRTANTQQRPNASPSGAAAGSTGSIFRGSAQSTITISQVVMQGHDTKGRCDQLLDWMNPGGGLLARVASAAISALTGMNLATGLPTLTFMWGPPGAAFMYDVKLTGATIDYKRFDPSGIPLRADVALTLQEQPSLLASMPTNPTSGGLPGRRIHVMSEGENLQTVSTASYGVPRYWRAIAEVNGIDDPLRVSPGRRLYLPNASELEGLAR